MLASMQADRPISGATAGAMAIVLVACGSPASQAGPGDDGAAPEGGDSSATSDSDAASGSDAGGTADAPSAVEAAVTDASQSPASDASPGGDAGSDGGAPGDAGTLMSVYVTFYGWADNSPPGNSIAYPRSGGYPTLHNGAGGTGTYADPITFATDRTELAVGTILYVPFIEKYVVMEDSCGQCATDWTTAHKAHIDLWMNSNGTESSASLLSCESQWTRSSTSVESGPPPDRPVTTRPLFDPATNACRTSP